MMSSRSVLPLAAEDSRHHISDGPRTGIETASRINHTQYGNLPKAIRSPLHTKLQTESHTAFDGFRNQFRSTSGDDPDRIPHDTPNGGPYSV